MLNRLRGKSEQDSLARRILNSLKKPQNYLTAGFGAAFASYKASPVIKHFLELPDPNSQDIFNMTYALALITLADTAAMAIIYSTAAEAQHYKSPKLSTYIKAEGPLLLGFFAAVPAGLAAGALKFVGLNKSANYIIGKMQDFRQQQVIKTATEYLSEHSPVRGPTLAREYFTIDRYADAVRELKQWIDQYNNDPIFRELLNDSRKAHPMRKNDKLLMERGRHRLFPPRTKEKYTELARQSYLEKFGAGFYALQMGHTERAVEFFSQAFETPYRSTQPDISMGIIMHSLGDKEKARLVIADAIRRNPSAYTESEYFFGSKRARKPINPLFGMTVALLEGTPAKLEADMAKMSRLEQEIMKHNLASTNGSVVPLGLFDVEGRQMLGVMYETGKLQSEIYPHSIDAQIAGMESLGAYQAMMTLDAVTDERVPLLLKQHVEHLMMPQLSSIPFGIPAEIISNLDVHYKFYSKHPYLADERDAHPDNAIMKPNLDGSWTTLQLDVEHKGLPGLNGYSRPENDDAKNLFQGLHLLRHPKPEEFVIDQIMNKNEIHNSLCKDGLQILNTSYPLSVLLTATPRALTYAFHTLNIGQPTEKAMQFMQMASWANDLIKDRYAAQFAPHEIMQLDNMNSAIIRLKLYYSSELTKFHEKEIPAHFIKL